MPPCRFHVVDLLKHTHTHIPSSRTMQTNNATQTILDAATKASSMVDVKRPKTNDDSAEAMMHHEISSAKHYHPDSSLSTMANARMASATVWARPIYPVVGCGTKANGRTTSPTAMASSFRKTARTLWASLGTDWRAARARCGSRTSLSTKACSTTASTMTMARTSRSMVLSFTRANGKTESSTARARNLRSMVLSSTRANGKTDGSTAMASFLRQMARASRAFSRWAGPKASASTLPPTALSSTRANTKME